MKILFTVQGEGRGHLTQAHTLSKILRNEGHEITAVVVGKSKSRKLPQFFLDKIGAEVHLAESPNFLPAGKDGHAPVARSIAWNIVRLPRFASGIRKIRQLAASADVVVNFYEILTGLAFGLGGLTTPLVCVGHQYLLLHPDFRLPAGHRGQLAMLNFFTRLTALRARRLLALSFRQMPRPTAGRTTVVPPLIREEVKNVAPTRGGYLHGYLLNSTLAAEVEAWHNRHPDVPLHFFWDRTIGGETRYGRNLTFHGLDDTAFIRFMAGARAFATTAGFESVCEAMYLGKPTLMVPTHIEQLCNAVDAEAAGAGVRAEHFDLDLLNSLQPKPNERFRTWADRAETLFPQIIAAAAEAGTSYSLRQEWIGRLRTLWN